MTAFLEDARRERLAVLLLVLGALVLRVVYVLEASASPFFAEPILDGAYHLGWARALAHGDAPFHPGPFFRAPLYPWLLAACLKLFGDNLLIPRLAQCVLGAGTVLFTWLIARRVATRGVAFTAALLVATCWPLIYFDGELLLETLSVHLNMLALWLTLRVEPGARASRAVLAGLAWGLAAITRPNVLVLLPLACVWLAAIHRPAWRAGLVRVAAFTLGALVPILPITAWNTFVERDFVLIASQGGVNLWIGNNPSSDGATAIVPGTRGGWWDGYHDSIALAEQAAGRPLKASEVSAHYASKAWAFLLGEPSSALALMWRKTRLFSFDREIGNNHDPEFFARHYSVVMRCLPLSFGWLASFALLGLVVGARKERARVLLLGYVLVYAASVIAFFVNSRFRAQVLPVLAIEAAIALAWLVAAARARRWLALGAAVALLAGGVWFCKSPPAGVLVDDSNGWLQLARHARDHGDARTAAQHASEAVRENAGNVYALIELGKALDRLDDAAGAIQRLRDALGVDPASSDALEALLGLHFRRRQWDLLESLATQACAAVPTIEVPHYWLGRMHRERGRAPEAVQAFRAALARDARSFRAAKALGETLAGLQQRDAAIEALVAAAANVDRALAPEDVEALQLLVRLLDEAGDARRARGYRDELERRRARR